MHTKVKVLVLVVLLSLFASLFGSIVTANSASAKGPDCVYHHLTKEDVTKGANHYKLTLTYKGCARPHAVKEIKWVKPMAVFAGYHTAHYFLHNSMWCTPEGLLSYYVFRFYISSPTTGYHRHVSMNVDCQHDGRNADVKGAVQLPRCYTPWIVTSEGRGGQKGHRAGCYLHVTVERVEIGPFQNEHQILIKSARIHPFLNN